MGWSLGDMALTVGTGGIYGSYKLAKDASNSGSSTRNRAYKKVKFGEADKNSAEWSKKYYGNTLNDLGSESENYVNRLYGNLDKNYAKADVINQQGAAQRALDNARAGLSGTDMSAQNEQNRRSAGIEATMYNEQMRANALDKYGESIANRITGDNTIRNQNRALEVASMKAPSTQISSGGILSGIFDGIF